MDDFKQNFITSFDRIGEILERTKRIAVLGIKTEAQRGQPSIDVPEYMQDNGYEIVPVPVYYPEVTSILGEPVYRSVSDIPGALDMVNVFRRAQDVPPHVDDIIAARPRVVWMQLGIVNAAAAEAFARAGIEVVQDRCLMVDHARYLAIR